MRIKLAYGRTGLTACLPDGITTVVEPTFVPGLPNESGAVRTGIRNPIGSRPLREIAASDSRVAISICDVTRPMPSSVVLPVLLGELQHLPLENITIIVATGTHRENNPEEIARMVGKEVAASYRIISHDGFDANCLRHLGDTRSGIPNLLNSVWVDADVRITTGFVEPHFFAGFSGGGGQRWWLQDLRDSTRSCDCTMRKRLVIHKRGGVSP